MNFAKLSSKIILVFLTILFWGCAAGLGYIGVNIFMSYERYGDVVSYLYSVLPAFIVLAIAAFMFLIGLIGACALFSENRCLLSVHFSLVTCLLGAEIAGVVLLFMYRRVVNQYVNSLFDEVLEKYGRPGQTRLTQNFDYVQFKLQCCGEYNYTDWHNTWWFQHNNNNGNNNNNNNNIHAGQGHRWGQVPQSCCVNFKMNAENNNQLINTVSKRLVGIREEAHYCQARAPEPIPMDNYYPSGCYAKIKQLIRSRFVYIAGVLLAVVVIQLVGLLSTCVLMFCRNKSKQQQPPYINIATHEDANYNL